MKKIEPHPLNGLTTPIYLPDTKPEKAWDWIKRLFSGLFGVCFFFSTCLFIGFIGISGEAELPIWAGKFVIFYFSQVIIFGIQNYVATKGKF